jgi:hypothetical protein
MGNTFKPDNRFVRSANMSTSRKRALTPLIGESQCMMGSFNRDQDRTPPLRLGGLHNAWIVAATGAVAMFCGLGLGRFALWNAIAIMSASLELKLSQSGMLGFTNLIELSSLLF